MIALVFCERAFYVQRYLYALIGDLAMKNLDQINFASDSFATLAPYKFIYLVINCTRRRNQHAVLTENNVYALTGR